MVYHTAKTNASNLEYDTFYDIFMIDNYDSD